MSAAERYVFGDFVLERSQQRVRRRDGSPLDLPPRLFSALLLFVENAGALLDKDALMRALWPGLVVEENSLSQIISGLRRALENDSHDSRYIQTVPLRGFRFIAAVTELPDLPATERSPMDTTESVSRAGPPPQLVSTSLAEPAIGLRKRSVDRIAADRRRW